MEITSLDAPGLSVLGREAIGHLLRNDFASLAARFGYALSYGRDTAAAIQEDFTRVLGELGAAAVLPNQQCPEPGIGYFKPNSAGLLALVEFSLLADNSAHFLVELIATGNPAKMYLTLEQISDARPSNRFDRDGRPLNASVRQPVRRVTSSAVAEASPGKSRFFRTLRRAMVIFVIGSAYGAGWCYFAARGVVNDDEGLSAAELTQRARWLLVLGALSVVVWLLAGRPLRSAVREK